MQSCNKNNPDTSYTERKAIHELCGYSLDLVCSFDLKGKKHSFYRGRDCIKKFWKKPRELGTKIINWEQKEMKPLTSDEVAFYNNQKECYICIKGFVIIKKKKRRLNYIEKLEIIVISLENLEGLLIAFVI